MYKYNILVFVSILFCFTTFAQGTVFSFGDDSNEPRIIKLNGIKKELVYKYSFNSNGITDSVLTNTFYYDTEGYPVKEILAKIDNYDESVTEYSNTYTEDGKLKRQLKNSISLKMIRIIEFDFDTYGFEINKYDYNKDTTDLKIEQKIYNAKNQVIQLQTKINNKNFYISRKYYYDSVNNLIRTDAFDKTDGYIYSYIYEYNKAENKKISYLKNDDGKKLIGEYFYNADGQAIKVKSILKMATFMSQEGTDFNTANQLRENTYNTDKMLFETTITVDGKKAAITRHYYFEQ